MPPAQSKGQRFRGQFSQNVKWSYHLINKTLLIVKFKILNPVSVIVTYPQGFRYLLLRGRTCPFGNLAFCKNDAILICAFDLEDEGAINPPRRCFGENKAVPGSIYLGPGGTGKKLLHFFLMTMDRSIEAILFDVDALRDFTEKVFKRIGVPTEDAKIAADVLIEADLRGFDCHGIARLYPCYARIQHGLIETNPKIEIKWLTPTTGYCNGGNGIGMVVGWHAMNACIVQAKEFGSAFLTVSRSNHFGIAGYYSSMAIGFDMIGIAMSNASPRVVPTGGTTGILGTNPISVAIPRKGDLPFILDMSTSTVSSGKLDVAVRKGLEIPEGWVYPSVEPFLDSEGVVPMSVLQYPLGGRKETSGYKGYGLAMMVDILSGVLPGANFGSRLAASKQSDREANIGHFFGAMKIAGFREVEEFNKDFELLVEDIKSSPLEPGAEKIFIHGEPEIFSKKENQKKGIPILPPVMKKLKQIAAELNLNFPE